MSDSEENRSGASSALLNIASAYSDSDSNPEISEDPKPRKSLGSLVENLRAEAKRNEIESKPVEVQSRANIIPVTPHAAGGETEKSHPLTKIVRLDSGKVVKISTGPVSDFRNEETHSRLFHGDVIKPRAAVDPVVTNQHTLNERLINSKASIGISKSSPAGGSECNKLESVVSKEIPQKVNELNKNVNDSEGKKFGVINASEVFDIHSDLNSVSEGKNLRSEFIGESRGSDDRKAMGLKNTKENARLDTDNGDKASTVDSQVEIVKEVPKPNSDPEIEIFSEFTNKNSRTSLQTGDSIVFSARSEFSGDSGKDVVAKPSPVQGFKKSQNEETIKFEPKTESNILNAYLKSKLENKNNREREIDIGGKLQRETRGHDANEERRFQVQELGQGKVEKLSPAASDVSKNESDRVDFKSGDNLVVVNVEECHTDKPDIYEVKPRPELKPLPRLERIKIRPPVAAQERPIKKTESELKESSPALYKMLESCEAHQPKPVPEVKRTIPPGPIKLKRNFGFISSTASEQQDKKFHPEPLETARPSIEVLPDITIIPTQPEPSPQQQQQQQQESIRSPPKIQIPSPSSLSPLFQQVSQQQQQQQQQSYQSAFSNKIAQSQNQLPSFQTVKKTSAPVTQRVTRREEHKRTLPLILRKAEISGAKRDISKMEEAPIKVPPPKEEVYSISSSNASLDVEMDTASLESQELSVSVPFSSSSSNQEMSNSGGTAEFASSVDSKDSKVLPLPGDLGSDNAMPPPTQDGETKEPTSFLPQPEPAPVETPTVIVPKKRGRPRKFPLPETPTVAGAWPTPTEKSSKPTPKSSKRKKPPKVKVEKEVVDDDETPKKRYIPRYKKKKTGEGEEAETPRSFNKKGRMEVVTEGCKPVTVNQITEYFWPPISSLPAGEKPEGLMIQEQISEYLGVKSFKRKYPSIKRRPVDMEERNYLQENGYVSENMCDMGLTAVYSADIIEIMYNDFPHKFDEYRRYTREKKIKEQKALREKQAAENMDPRKEALESTVSWNTEFNKTRNFNYKVLLGEWYERKFEEEYKLAMYLKKKERNQLLIAKVRALFTNLLKEVQLSLPSRGLAYGGIIQLMAPDVIGRPPIGYRGADNKGLVLAVTVEPEELDHKQGFEENLLLVGSPELQPCVRNSFYIDPEDKRKNGQPVCFGDVFSLRCAGDTEVPLYVSVPVLSPFAVTGASGYPNPRLKMFKDFDARFKVMPVDEKSRKESQGLTVSPFEKVLVFHVPVEIPLCVESMFWKNSLFSPECEISVHSTQNLKKEYLETNQWVFVVGSLK